MRNTIADFNKVINLVNDCEQAITKVTGNKVTINLIDENVLGISPRGRLFLLRKVIVEHFEIDRVLYMSKARNTTLVRARQFLAYIAWHHIKGVTLKEMGEVTGGRDHATMINNRDNCEQFQLLEKEYKAEYDAVKMAYDMALVLKQSKIEDNV